MLTEGIKSYNDIASNRSGSVDAAAALANLAGMVSGYIDEGLPTPFTKSLSAALGVNIGAIGVILSGIQLSNALQQYRDALNGTDGVAQKVAFQNLADKTFGVVASVGGMIAAVPGLQLLGLGIWTGATLGQQVFNGNMSRAIDIVGEAANDLYLQARRWQPPRDPLVLDLDGDGIDAVGIAGNSPILFDHDADGVRTGTGWIKPDDGFVVLDRDGNGLIDSGRELFGDETLLANGSKAPNGYAALAQHDSNGDGRIDSADAVYGQLRIWQDANQDGISQTGELHHLAELGIASIGVQGTQANVDLGNGNTMPLRGTFTRTDGSAGSSGVAELSGSLLLAGNGFYREFTDDPEPTVQANGLPQMRGSGWVRDLREAMSLTSGEGLQAGVVAFAAAATREAQLALVDGILTEWATSSGRLLTSIGSYNLERRPGQSTYEVVNFSSAEVGDVVLSIWPTGMSETVNRPVVGPIQQLTDEGREFLRRLNVLEVFNGTRFVEVAIPTGTRLAIELLYFANLKLVEIAELHLSDCIAPSKECVAWRLQVDSMTNSMRCVYALPPLGRSLSRWHKNLAMSPQTSLSPREAREKSAVLFERSVNLMRSVKRILRLAMKRAEAEGDLDCVQELRTASPICFRSALEKHAGPDGAFIMGFIANAQGCRSLIALYARATDLTNEDIEFGWTRLAKHWMSYDAQVSQSLKAGLID